MGLKKSSLWANTLFVLIFRLIHPDTKYQRDCDHYFIPWTALRTQKYLCPRLRQWTHLHSGDVPALLKKVCFIKTARAIMRTSDGALVICKTVRFGLCSTQAVYCMVCEPLCWFSANKQVKKKILLHSRTNRKQNSSLKTLKFEILNYTKIASSPFEGQ